MSHPRNGPAAPDDVIFELKSTAWTVTALRLRSADVGVIHEALNEAYADNPQLFEQEPLVIDLTALAASDPVVDFNRLLGVLRHCGFVPVGVASSDAAQLNAAAAAGLAQAPAAGVAPRNSPLSPPGARASGPADDASKTTPTGPAKPAAETIAAPATSLRTMVVTKPLRSGQRVYARSADLIVMAVVSHGAEIIADGHIHVYAPLRGRAMAGASGDTSARIFATCMEPQLVAIAGIYRTSETALPAGVLGRPAQVWLDGERLNIEALTS